MYPKVEGAIIGLPWWGHVLGSVWPVNPGLLLLHKLLEFRAMSPWPWNLTCSSLLLVPSFFVHCWLTNRSEPQRSSSPSYCCLTLLPGARPFWTIEAILQGSFLPHFRSLSTCGHPEESPFRFQTHPRPFLKWKHSGEFSYSHLYVRSVTGLRGIQLSTSVRWLNWWDADLS